MDRNEDRIVLGRRFYPEPVITLILEKISTGQTVTQICSDPAMPCAASWFKWVSEDQALSKRYEQARAAARQRKE
jgi:hypothetical protein